MFKIVTLTKISMKFPPDCIICGAPAKENVSIERLFLYSTGGRGILTSRLMSKSPFQCARCITRIQLRKARLSIS
jgi:hypothetical protein